jgi:hypothetical protein
MCISQMLQAIFSITMWARGSRTDPKPVSWTLLCSDECAFSNHAVRFPAQECLHTLRVTGTKSILKKMRLLVEVEEGDTVVAAMALRLVWQAMQNADPGEALILADCKLLRKSSLVELSCSVRMLTAL